MIPGIIIMTYRHPRDVAAKAHSSFLARVIKLTEDILSGGRHFTKEVTEWTGQIEKGKVENKSNEKSTSGKTSE